MKRNLGLYLSEQLENDLIPDSLNFTLEQPINIDLSKVSYNNYYNSFEFAASKFPNGWQSIAGFDKVIETIASSYKLPLDEMIDRQLEQDKINAEWKSIESFENIFGNLNIKSQEE